MPLVVESRLALEDAKMRHLRHAVIGRRLLVKAHAAIKKSLLYATMRITEANRAHAVEASKSKRDEIILLFGLTPGGDDNNKISINTYDRPRRAR